MSAAPGARLAAIVRHPIKSVGFEELESVALMPGLPLPGDRAWAVAHAAAELPADGGWAPKRNFLRGVASAALMAIRAETLSDGRLRLSHPAAGRIDIDPEAEGARLLAWLAPLWPDSRAAPARLVRAPATGMADTPDPFVAVLSQASLRALGQRMGRPLSIHRFRGNLWLDGLPPWEEFEWIGRRLRVGGAVLLVRERIGRCKATTANPETGRFDADTLGVLEAGYGHTDFGVYAEVVERGALRLGDAVEVLGMTLPFPLAAEPETEASERGRKLFAGPVTFLKGVVALDGLPPADRVEVCFAGRSNVGKSSLINALTGRKTLARTSNTPGRTQELNYFALGEQGYLVDLPGYGFAEAPKPVVAKWQALLKAYLAGRPTLRRAFVLIDHRHGIKAPDAEIMDLLDRAAVTFQVVLTKADKVRAAERAQVLAQVRAGLAKHPAAFPELVVTSSETGQGLETLRALIAGLE